MMKSTLNYLKAATLIASIFMVGNYFYIKKEDGYYYLKHIGKVGPACCLHNITYKTKNRPNL